MPDTPVPDPSASSLPARAVASQRAVHAAKPSEGRLKRLQSESTELVQDVKDWVELRIDLVRAEVQESIAAQIDGRKASVLALAIPGVIGAIGAFFLLVTLALFLGWWLGHAAWGFLIVTALLLLVAGVARAVLARRARAVSTPGTPRTP